MPIQSSGELSFSSLQSEFGGTNPISLSEYYRNAGLVTPNNTAVATSGPISISSFYGAYKTSTVSQITNALKTGTYANVRNQLFSRTSFAAGMEPSLATTFGSVTSNTYRYNTLVSAGRVWPTSYDASFAPMLATSYITVIMRNVSAGSLANELYVNGVLKTQAELTNAAYGSLGVRMSYANIPVSYSALTSGINISANYYKGSSNTDNLQELFVLPGKWEGVISASSTGITAASLGSVAVNDIAFAIRTGQQDLEIDEGVWGGTSGLTQIMRRNSHWYVNTTSAVAVVGTAGTLNFTPNIYTIVNSSGNVTGSQNHTAFASVFRCTQV